MSNSYNPISLTFFQDFYKNCLAGHEPLQNILIATSNDGSIGIDTKSSWCLVRFFKQLFWGVSYDLPSQVQKIQESANNRLQAAKAQQASLTQDMRLQLSDELVALSKTSRSVKQIIKHVKAKKPQLVNAEHDMRVKQYAALSQAGELLGQSSWALCCSRNMFSEALAFIGEKSDLVDVKEHFSTLLHHAIRKGKIDKANILLAQGATLASLCKEDQLSYSMQTHNQAEACRLLANGAKVDITIYKQPILHYALEHNLADALRGLLKHGASPDGVDSRGQIPLHLVTKAENLTLLTILLEYNADVNKSDNHKTTALHIAAKKGQINLVQALLCYDATVNKADRFGDTALHFACQAGKTDVVEALIQKGAPINAKNSSQTTALHNACDGQNLDIVKILLANRASVNALTAEEETPLHRASAKAQIDLCQLLIAHGADHTIQNSRGETALRLPLNSRFPLSNEAKKRFYLAFFGYSRLATTWLQNNQIDHSFLTYLSQNAQELVIEAKRAKTNPYEFPFILQDVSLTRALSATMSQREFRVFLESLSKAHPAVSLDLIAYAPYQINPAHYAKGNLNLRVPAPARNISLERYLAHFDACNSNDPDSADFLDLNKVASEAGTANRVRLREGLQLMLQKVTNRVAFLGTPKEGSPALREFYQNIENALKNVLITLEELRDRDLGAYRTMQKAVMFDLLCMMNHCGGRYFSVSVCSYLKYAKGEKLTFADDMYQSLADFREVLMQATIPNGPNNVHEYNSLVRSIGRKYGLPGFQVFESFADPFSHVNIEQSERQFKKNYTTKAIVKEWLSGSFAEGAFREKYLDWQKSQNAKRWDVARYAPISLHVAKLVESRVSRAEIIAYLDKQDILVNGENQTYSQAIEEDQAHAYISNAIMDEQTGALKEEAIYDMLIQMQVLTSCFA